MGKIARAIVGSLGILLFINISNTYSKSIVIDKARIAVAENDPFACALLVADTIQNPYAKSEVLYKIAKAYADVGRQSDSLRISRQIEESFFKSKAVAYLVVKYWDSKEYDTAKGLLEEALKYAKEVGHDYSKSLALVNISVKYFFIGEQEKADKILFQLDLDHSLLAEAANLYSEIGNKEKAKEFLAKAFDDLKADSKKPDYPWDYYIPEYLADIALKYLKIGENRMASEILQYAYEVALRTKGLIKDRPWLLKDFALKCAEAKKFDLALKVIERMGEQETVSRYSDYKGDHEERQKCPKTAALAEIAPFYLKAGQKDKSLEILSQALEVSGEIKYHKEKELISLLITCKRMQALDASLPLEKMLEPYFKSESIRKEINADPMKFLKEDFGGDHQQLAQEGKYLQAVRSAAKIENYYFNQAFMQVKEPVLIEIVLTFAKTKQPVDEDAQKFLRAIIDQIDWQAEEHKDAIWKSQQSQAEEDKAALIKNILPDTSWVTIDTPVYYISNPHAMDPKDTALYSIEANGKNKFKICEGRVKFANISPDGRYVLLVGGTDNYKKEIIYLFDRKNKETKLVKELEEVIPEEGYDIERWIPDISWATDSKRFTYVVLSAFRFQKDKIGREKQASMKDFGYRENGYLISIDDFQEKKLFNDRFLSSSGFISEMLFWDKDNKHLYFTELKNDKYFIISLDVDSLKEAEIKSLSASLVKQRRMFHGGTIYSKAISEKGEHLFWGWDSEGNYYIYKNIKGEEKKILRFPRSPFMMTLYFERPAWLPGGRYALLQFLDKIVIIEPSTGKIGILTEGEYLSPADYENKEKWVY